MTEKLINCPRCNGNACSEINIKEDFTIWNCMGCGFTTNSTMTDENFKEIEITLPELYKDLKFKDKNTGLNWVPLAVTLENKAMVFAEGTTVEDWKWSAVRTKKGKVDMSTKKEFEQNNFLDALEYAGYFKLK